MVSLDELIDSTLAGARLPTKADGVPDRPVGICCSGGGIRSAAFCLGAIQVLSDEGLLAEATHISAVSGANYVVSAMYITAAESEARSLEESAPWSAGSVEESRLRSHTNYLAPGFAGRVWLFVNLFYGALLNYTPIFLGSFVAGRVLGWAIAALAPSVRSGSRIGAISIPLSGVIAAVALAAVLLISVADFRRADKASVGESRSTEIELRQRTYRWLASALGGVAAVLVVGPMAIVASRRLVYLATTVLSGDSPGFGTEESRLPTATGASYLALAAGTLSLGLAGALVVVLARRRASAVVLPFLSGTIGYGLLLAPFLASASYAAGRGFHGPGALTFPGIAAAILLAFGLFIHNAHYSMHLYYRQRLAWGFAVRRIIGITGDGYEFRAKRLPYAGEVPFLATVERARAKYPDLPVPIVCAAANLTDHDIPRGRNVASFVFTPTESGGPDVGRIPTSQMAEELKGRTTPLTYPTLMAVSGAALSPVMGRFTRNSIRLLMALLNVRLGIWIPNSGAEVRRRRKARAEARAVRAAAARHSRLWTVLWGLADGWREPGALYVLREGLGALSRHSQYIYVTDGGHWENLGLVELLRAGCRDVICLDASTDALGGLAALGQAASLMRTELGLELDIETRGLEPGEDGLCEDCVGIGSIRTLDGSIVGRITVVRAAMSSEISVDLREFRRREPRFPTHSTAEQFYRDDRFEAYRALGRFAALRAVAARRTVTD